ncbi:MAG: stage III sporulation protein AA [Clostridiales bacterium]|nr:stage III sporulation protein AA [Clostridiales bacterium]
MDRREELIRIFSKDIRTILRQVPVDFDQVQEIRLRVRAPLLMICNNREYYLTQEGKLSGQVDSAHVVTLRELQETLEYAGSYSLYAYEEELKQGFITIQGGHRVGVSGKVITDAGRIRGMKFISFINVRVSHQIRGCADRIVPFLYKNRELMHTMIVSAPCRGKTTLLRDIIRQISDGSDSRPGMTVGVVDERSELAPCYQGQPQNDLGIRTDVLDSCPKAQGMMMLIRAMSPRVIAVDEIGGREDVEAVEYVMNCGCKVIATVHGTSIEDLRRKPVLGRMVGEHWFERYIVLGSRGHIGEVEGIFDSRGFLLGESERKEHAG